MKVVAEIPLDLTAQSSTDPSTVVPIEVDDIEEFDPLLNPRTAANTDTHPEPAADDETIEIELSNEQIDAMLSGRSPR